MDDVLSYAANYINAVDLDASVFVLVCQYNSGGIRTTNTLVETEARGSPDKKTWNRRGWDSPPGLGFFVTDIKNPFSSQHKTSSCFVPLRMSPK